MRQRIVLGEHAVAYLESTCIVEDVVEFEYIVIAVTTSYLEGLYRVDVVLTFLIGGEGYELQTDSIVKSSLINDKADAILLADQRQTQRESDPTSRLHSPSTLRSP